MYYTLVPSQVHGPLLLSQPLHRRGGTSPAKTTYHYVIPFGELR